MSLRASLAAILRRAADRLDPHKYSSEEALRELAIVQKGFDSLWHVTKILLDSRREENNSLESSPVTEAASDQELDLLVEFLLEEACKENSTPAQRALVLFLIKVHQTLVEQGEDRRDFMRRHFPDMYRGANACALSCAPRCGARAGTRHDFIRRRTAEILGLTDLYQAALDAASRRNQ